MDFDEILKRSVTSVNAGYEAALADLRKVIGQLDAAVKNNAGAKYGFVLQELHSDIKGTTFRTYFDTDVNNARATIMDILAIRLPAAGYPLSVGTFDKGNKSFHPLEELPDVDALNRVFVTLIREPDSALIQAIGFALRNKALAEDDIPW